MENRMRNTFVVLALVALVRSSLTTEISPTPVTAPQATPTTPVSDTTHLPSSSPATTNVHPESGIKSKIVANNGSANPVQIDLFYEALCKDSVDFVQNQLTKVDDKLHKYISVSFYPFAQGNITKVDGHYNITCKREGECDADKVHVCGIENIKDSEKLLKFVNCSMVKGLNNPKSVPIELCGKNSNLENEVVTAIKTCAADNSIFPKLEIYLQKAHENNVTTVPKILINGKYTEETQQLSLTNLLKVICDLIPESDSLSECKNAGSGSSAVVVGILPVLISAYYFIRMF